MLPLNSSERRIRPASMVFPRPTLVGQQMVAGEAVEDVVGNGALMRKRVDGRGLDAHV